MRQDTVASLGRVGSLRRKVGGGPRFKSNQRYPERHATSRRKPQNTQTNCQDTQQRNDTAKTLHNETIPRTPDRLSPAPECTKFLGSGTTPRLPQTPPHAPRAQLFHPAALVFLSSCAYVCTRVKVTLSHLSPLPILCHPGEVRIHTTRQLWGGA